MNSQGTVYLQQEHFSACTLHFKGFIFSFHYVHMCAFVHGSTVPEEIRSWISRSWNCRQLCAAQHGYRKPNLVFCRGRLSSSDILL